MKHSIISETKGVKEDKTEEKCEEIKEEVPVPEAVVKSEKTGNITLIGLNRAEVRNCINSETAQLLSAEIEKFENDPESPVAVLYGVGGNFCAGYDMKELAKNKETISSLLLRSEGAMVSTSTSILPLILSSDNSDNFRVQLVDLSRNH